MVHHEFLVIYISLWTGWLNGLITIFVGYITIIWLYMVMSLLLKGLSGNGLFPQFFGCSVQMGKKKSWCFDMFRYVSSPNSTAQSLMFTYNYAPSCWSYRAATFVHWLEECKRGFFVFQDSKHFPIPTEEFSIHDHHSTIPVQAEDLYGFIMMVPTLSYSKKSGFPFLRSFSMCPSIAMIFKSNIPSGKLT